MREEILNIQPFQELRIEGYVKVKQINEHARAKVTGAEKWNAAMRRRAVTFTSWGTGHLIWGEN